MDQVAIQTALSCDQDWRPRMTVIGHAGTYNTLCLGGKRGEQRDLQLGWIFGACGV